MFISQVVFQNTAFPPPLWDELVGDGGVFWIVLRPSTLDALSNVQDDWTRQAWTFEGTSQELFPHPVRSRSISRSPV